MDQLQSKGRVETLIRSLSKFSEQALLIISGQSDITADAKKIGPTLIFERLWKETGIKAAIERVLARRKFEFDIELAIFLTVLHRLMVSGSDRFYIRWCRDYFVEGIDGLDLHHLYRAMGFLGEAIDDQIRAPLFRRVVISASRFVARCGPAIQLMSQRCFPLLSGLKTLQDRPHLHCGRQGDDQHQDNHSA